MSIACSKAMREIIEELNLPAQKVIEGGAETAIELTQTKFDLLIFTGSPAKGILVGQSAAKNIVPCVLELGGKCPFIIDKDADLN